MDYGLLLTRAWNVIWDNKFLILLGVLVALGSGNTSNNLPGSGSRFGLPGGEAPFGEGPGPGEYDWDFDEVPDFSEIFKEFGPEITLVTGMVVAVIVVLLVVALVVWAVSTIARGGLIGGVDQIEAVGASSLGQAWNAGWQRGWRLVGIGLIPAIPTLAMAAAVAALLVPFFAAADSFEAAFEGLFETYGGVGMLFGLGAIVCVGALVKLVLDILRTFANRACVLEDTKVFQSYGRGWQVLRENLGQALLLFLLQIVIGIILAVLLFIPSIFMAICCFLWPVLLAIAGTKKAYFSTLWTLAWREWAGGLPGGEPALEEVPAV